MIVLFYSEACPESKKFLSHVSEDIQKNMQKFQVEQLAAQRNLPIEVTHTPAVLLESGELKIGPEAFAWLASQLEVTPSAPGGEGFSFLGNHDGFSPGHCDVNGDANSGIMVDPSVEMIAPSSANRTMPNANHGARTPAQMPPPVSVSNDDRNVSDADYERFVSSRNL